MKTNKKILISSIMLSLFITGCANKAPTKKEILEAEKMVINDISSDPLIISETSAMKAREEILESGGFVSLEKSNVPDSIKSNLFVNNIVNFKFDSYELDDKSKENIKIHIDFLKENNNIKVILEGHTDERGDLSYNLTLGERRANAVKSYMVSNNVNEKQIEVISFGESKPLINESNESSWSKNRRVNFIYK